MSPIVQHFVVWHTRTNILGKPGVLALSILFCPEDRGSRLPQHVDTYPSDCMESHSKACHLPTKKITRSYIKYFPPHKPAHPPSWYIVLQMMEQWPHVHTKFHKVYQMV